MKKHIIHSKKKKLYLLNRHDKQDNQEIHMIPPPAISSGTARTANI